MHHDAVDYETARSTDVDPSNVEARDDFVRFLSAVLADFRSTGEAEWDNGTRDRFLDGLSAPAPSEGLSPTNSKPPGTCLPRSSGQRPGTSSAPSFAADRARVW